MDENPYKAPAEDEGPRAPRAKWPEFLDPVKNLTMLIVIVAVLGLGYIAAMRRAGVAREARARAVMENTRIGAP